MDIEHSNNNNEANGTNGNEVEVYPETRIIDDGSPFHHNNIQDVKGIRFLIQQMIIRLNPTTH